MSAIIPDETLHAARLSAQEAKQELAVVLYAQEKFTLGQASRLAELSQYQFQHLLASRSIPIHYDTGEWQADVETLRQLKTQ